MAILHRAAYLSLSALLMIAPAACGGDDDGDDGDDGTTADAGDDDGGDDGEPDAGDDGGDDGEPDAGDEDAGKVEGDQFLLGLNIDAGVLVAGVRIIATINLVEDSADITLQPVIAPECDKATAGEPVGEPRTETGVAVTDGAFELTLDAATLAAGSVDALCDNDVVGDLTVTGTVLKSGPCGELSGSVAMPVPIESITGSFGSLPIEPGTPAADLPVFPDLPVACAK
jgi:hypothetical protein